MKKIDSVKLNFCSNLLGFLLTYSVSFFLSPYIVGVLGEDAYGFVSLATNFTNYISLATVALNSLAGRFISIQIFKGDMETAKKYYSSVMIADLIVSLILLVPCTLFVLNINFVISVPAHLLTDVKILFSLVFAGFFISLLTSLFSVGIFVENKLYLNALGNVIGSAIRLILSVILFSLFPAKIMFIGITIISMNIFSLLWQKHHKKKFLPELKVSCSFFDIYKITELIKSGAWSLVSNLSSILNNGLDLLLANIYINPTSMGVLSIASTLPAAVHAIMGAVSSSFTPNLTKHYACGEFGSIVAGINRSTRFMSVVLIVPMAGLTVFGYDFYRMWQPTQDAFSLQVLSVIKIAALVFSGTTAAIHEIFVITNRLKIQSLATLISGILNVIIVYILLETTSLGIYAIAGVAVLITTVRNFIITFPYAAKCINQKWYVFVVMSLRSAAVFGIVCAFFYAVRSFVLIPTTWPQFFVECIICGIAGMVLVGLLILNKDERKQFVAKFFKTKNGHA